MTHLTMCSWLSCELIVYSDSFDAAKFASLSMALIATRCLVHLSVPVYMCENAPLPGRRALAMASNRKHPPCAMLSTLYVTPTVLFLVISLLVAAVIGRKNTRARMQLVFPYRSCS